MDHRKCLDYVRNTIEQMFLPIQEQTNKAIQIEMINEKIMLLRLYRHFRKYNECPGDALSLSLKTMNSMSGRMIAKIHSGDFPMITFVNRSN